MPQELRAWPSLHLYIVAMPVPTPPPPQPISHCISTWIHATVNVGHQCMTLRHGSSVWQARPVHWGDSGGSNEPHSCLGVPIPRTISSISIYLERAIAQGSACEAPPTNGSTCQGKRAPSPWTGYGSGWYSAHLLMNNLCVIMFRILYMGMVNLFPPRRM